MHVATHQESCILRPPPLAATDYFTIKLYFFAFTRDPFARIVVIHHLWIRLYSLLVWAAEGDQLNDPVITLRLSMTANLWWASLRSVSQLGFSGMLMPLKPLVEPEGLGGDERATTGYKPQECLGFCLGAAVSQIPVTELDLEESTNPAE